MTKSRLMYKPSKIAICLLVIVAMFSCTYLTNTRILFAASNDAALSALTYDGKQIGKFTPDSFSGKAQTESEKDTVIYNVELPSGATKVPVVEAVATEGSVLGAITQAESLPGDAVVEVTKADIKHFYKISFTVASMPANAYYHNNGSGANPAQWVSNLGGQTTPAAVTVADINGETVITTTTGGNNNVFDTQALNYAGQTNGFVVNDALYHVKARFGDDAPDKRFGLNLRNIDGRNHATVAFDDGKLSYHSHVNGRANNVDNIAQFSFKPNTTYDIAAQIIGQQLTVLVDGSKILDYTIAQGQAPYIDPENPGEQTYKFGYRLWFALGTSYVDDMYVAPIDPQFGKVPLATDKNEFEAPSADSFATIATESLKVTVGKDFPFVYSYRNAADNKFLANGINPSLATSTKMNINGSVVEVNSALKEFTATSRTYTITAIAAATEKTEAVDCVITALLALDGNKLRLSFPSVVENNDTMVKYFGMVNLDMVTVAGAGGGAAFGGPTGWGPMGDKFINLNESAETKVSSSSLSYALMYDTKAGSAIAFESNALDSFHRYYATERVSESVVDSKVDKSVSVNCSAWYWHYFNKTTGMIPGYVPYVEVIVGGDANEDGEITWQDAGVLYRDIRKVPFGGEDVKNYWNYIAMNMSNSVGNPSLGILDRAKAISYLTDGFGQKVMNKGYQVSGHDDSHGDYDNVSEQQGGIKDFEYLNNVGKNYNVKTGIHINMTEFALDGFETELENLRGYGTDGLKPNWNWIDQAYLVDKDKDIISGSLERRIDELKAALPNLDWVYVDVYQSWSSYDAKMAAYYLNKNGYTLATEAAGDFEGDTTFLHWNTDLYYPIGGKQSSVMRFLQNDIADKFAPDRALLGMTMPGVADWRNVTRFDDAREVFYRNNLPTKYLQHFNLQNWVVGESAKFEDGVTATVVPQVVDGYTKYFNEIKKDGNLIARVDVTNLTVDPSGGNAGRTTASKLFMPWSPETEEKIYCYNDYDASQEWTLPASWAGVTSASQYKLTDSGREFVKTVTPSNGKVTIDGDIGQAYILDKTTNVMGGLGTKRLPIAEGSWGEGSAIKNFGFTGKTLENWVSSGVTIDSTMLYQDISSQKSLDPRAEFAAAGGSLSQVITVEQGKTYSVSAWVKTENRNTTLQVSCGDKNYQKSIASTDIMVRSKPSKYLGQNYERIKVDFTALSNQATVSLNVDAGVGKAYADDFRIWKWVTQPQLTVNDDYDLVVEDFENVDQGYGAFVSQVGTQPYFHLAQKDIAENSKQIKNYVIDGEWSLKNQTTSAGIHMRTLPSTLKFVSGKTYRLTMDYQTYKESRKEVGTEAGFNMPIAEAMYALELRNADGTIVHQELMQPSTFESETYTYNSQPSVLKMDILLQDVTEGMYLTISKLVGGVNEIMVIDNLRIRENVIGLESYTKPADKTILVGQEHGLPTKVSVKMRDETTHELNISYGGFDKTKPGNQTVTGTIDTLDLITEPGFSKTFTVQITVKNFLSSYTKPVDKTIENGAEHGLPAKIAVKMADGTTQEFDVTYSGTYNKAVAGDYNLTGTINVNGADVASGFSKTFTVKVTVLEAKKGCGTVIGGDYAAIIGLAFVSILGLMAILLKRKQKSE